MTGAKTITQDRVRELLSYDPLTGIFRWRFNRGKMKAGDMAGGSQRKNKKLYVQIVVDGQHISGHRLAFVYMTGSLPCGEVDHIDGNGMNNAWSNLRDVDHGANLKNMCRRSDNTSGHTGVSWRKGRNVWRAYIKTPDGIHNLGSFRHLSDAVSARKAAERMYGFHQNHGQQQPEPPQQNTNEVATESKQQ